MGDGLRIIHTLRKGNIITLKSCNLRPQVIAIGQSLGGGEIRGTSISPAIFSPAFSTCWYSFAIVNYTPECMCRAPEMEEDIISRRKCHVYTGIAEWKYFAIVQNEHNIIFYFFFFLTEQLSPASLETVELSKPDATMSLSTSHLILALQRLHLPLPPPPPPPPPSPSHFWRLILILLLLLKINSNPHPPVTGDLRM